MKSRIFFKIVIVFAIMLIVNLFCCQNFRNSNNAQDLCEGKGKTMVDKIRERGKLIATTNYNSTSYFVYRGEPMGYQYEMLKAFASYLGVKLEIVIHNDVNEAINSLNNGECDIIAFDMTVTGDRNRLVDFTQPIGQTRQVLVQRKPDNWRRMRTWDEVESHLVRNPLDLAGKVVNIQKNSSYLIRLKNLEEEIGDTIFIAEDDYHVTEELIRMVANGEIDYTVSDENVALVNQNYYPEIDVATPISFPQHLAWAVRKGTPFFLKEVNTWLEQYKQSKEFYIVYNKYYKNPRTIKMAMSEFHSVTGGRLSEYDDIIKEYSDMLGWDWRLLASLIYQESGFDNSSRSWVGAFGLMQLMPTTAERFGVDTLSSPQENIAAGVKFLKYLDEQFEELVPDKKERIKFVMASYNVGIAHVFDAMRLASKYGKDPTVWTGNVDYFVLNKSNPTYYGDTSVVLYGYARGEEPFNFVNNILERYDHYRNVIN